MELTAALAAGAGTIGAGSAITTQHVQFSSLGAQVPAYAASPGVAGSATAGVVVVMHVWGVDASIRDVVDGFAKAGYAAIAPDLYARENAPPSGDGARDYRPFAAFAQKLDRAQVDADLRVAAMWLRSQHPQAKIGVIGFCMGGGIALRQAIDNADVFAADAVCYGKLEGTDPARVAIPIVGSFGAKDTGIPADSVRAFAAGLRVPNDVVIYPDAGHAFFDSHRSSYVASAAQDGWRRILSFFGKYLRQ